MNIVDIFPKEKRSEIMRSVKSKNNISTEKLLIKMFKKNNIKGWRRGYKVKGKPDFVFLKHRVAIFIDGCFWHGHCCRNLIPKSNVEYWNQKISKNIFHDREIDQLFLSRQWKVVRIWECELKRAYRDGIITKILEALN